MKSKYFLFLLIGFASIATSQAQQENSRDRVLDRVFSESFEVRLITVEVVVTDKKGNQVPGLKKEDFRLAAGGQETEIQFFEEIFKGEVQKQAGEPSQKTETQPSQRGTYRANDYLVFIDDYFTKSKFRKSMIDQMIRDLKDFRPEDRMAIVRFKGKQLEVISGWQSDKNTLRQRFEKNRNKITGYSLRETKLSTAGQQNNRARVLSRQIDRVAGAVAVAMRSFSDQEKGSLPRRKLLVLLSGGWPIRPQFNDSETRNYFSASRYLNASRLRPISDTANSLGYTIYPMQLDLPESNISAADGGPPSQIPLFDSEFSIGLDSMSFLADETGGLAHAKALVRKTPLKQVFADNRSYYVLGFPGDGGMNHRKSIKVTLNKPGLRARHRANFRVLSRQETISMKVEAAMLLGIEDDPLQVVVGKPKRKGTFRVELPLSLYIPMNWASTFTHNGQVKASMELRILVEDDLGGRSELSVIPLKLSGPKLTAGDKIIYNTSLKLRRRKHRLVLSLRDVPTGKVRTQMVEFNPKAR